MQEHTRPVIIRWLALGALTLPILYLTWFVFTRTVNVPFWDQWEIVPIIKNINEGNLNWHDFWRQHNEHRLLFPRIIMLTSAFLTNWNTKTETLISIILAVMSFCVLIKAIHTNDKSTIKRPIYGLLFLFSLVWFSPLQYENWLWGWQIQWYLNVLGVLGVVYAVARLHKDRDSTAALGIGIGSAVLAQYSLGNGVLLWPILVGSMWLLKINRRKVAIAAGAAAVFTALYYVGYHNLPGPSKTASLSQPVDLIKYYFAYLGRPLTFRPKLSAIFGLTMLVIFAGLAAYLFFKKRRQFDKSLPWFGLGAYVFMSAAITSLSRLGFGLLTSMTSRYTTISSLLVVAMAMLLYTNRDIFKRLAGNYFRYGVAALFVFVMVLVGLNYRWGIDRAEKQSLYLTDIRNCTHREVLEQICLLSAFPDEKTVYERLQYLKTIHWAGY